MSDLICRQDAIDAVAKLYKYESDRMTALQKVPTVEAKPVIHGEWIRKNMQKSWGKSTDLICSICGKKSWLGYNFCPNCGADMRKQYVRMKSERDYNRFTRKLNEKFAESGMTVEEFSEKTAIPEFMMKKYLSGDRVPRGPYIANMATVLDCTLNELLDLEEQKSEE